MKDLKHLYELERLLEDANNDLCVRPRVRAANASPRSVKMFRNRF